MQSSIIAAFKDSVSPLLWIFCADTSNKEKHYDSYQNCEASKLQHDTLCLLLGMTACTFTYPLDVVRSRLAFQVADEQIYCGVCHAIRQIFTTEGGFRALYRGFTATAVAMIPAVGELTACKHVENNLK